MIADIILQSRQKKVNRCSLSVSVSSVHLIWSFIFIYIRFVLILILDSLGLFLILWIILWLFFFFALIILSVEIKLIIRNLHVFSLRELVTKSWDKFGVYFQSERLNFINSFFQVILGIACELLHTFSPSGGLFKLGRRQNNWCGGNLRWSKFQKGGIEHGHFLNILSVAEDLLVSIQFRKSLISFKETVWGWCCYHESESLQNFFFHGDNLLSVEFIFTDGQ